MLSTTVDGRVMRLTIDRPERLNAINTELLDELTEICRVIRASPEIALLVIRGSGGKAFAAGADIGEFDSLSGPSGYEFAKYGQEVFQQLEDLPIPTVAAINGWALGGGCELAMACTFRLASDRSNLGLPEIKLGVMPGYGGTVRLARIVGESRALEMVLTGDPVSADRAERIGLVHQVFPAAEFDERVEQYIAVLLQRPPMSVQYALAAVRAGRQAAGPALFALEAAYAGLLTSTDDKREGVAAFREGREPRWTGR